MSKNKKSVGFRMGEDKEETQSEYWDVYPTHIYIPSDYWTVSTTTDEFNKKTKKTKKK
tara:strand:+ start:507 stop:680 length:174 start_codon:yes stop_codon:yes gene_type:complete